MGSDTSAGTGGRRARLERGVEKRDQYVPSVPGADPRFCTKGAVHSLSPVLCRAVFPSWHRAVQVHQSRKTVKQLTGNSKRARLTLWAVGAVQRARLAVGPPGGILAG